MSAAGHELRETLLKVAGVSHGYGGTPVLRDVNLEVRNIHRPGLTQGQVVALLGPSGIGKTTLFRILAGLETPNRGEVLLGETGRPVRRGEVGVVAQQYPLFAHRTVLGNLLVAGRSGGLSGSESRARAEELLARFGLEGHGGKYPSQLSGGQRQRAAIAQQFMCSEHILLMDEPFSGLDLVAVDTMCGFITEMAAGDEHATFIVVTHDVTAAIEVADTLWVMGRERNADGTVIPGARVIRHYDLIERGLAWRESVTSTPQFLDLLREIRELFPRL